MVSISTHTNGPVEKAMMSLYQPSVLTFTAVLSDVTAVDCWLHLHLCFLRTTWEQKSHCWLSFTSIKAKPNLTAEGKHDNKKHHLTVSFLPVHPWEAGGGMEPQEETASSLQNTGFVSRSPPASPSRGKFSMQHLGKSVIYGALWSSRGFSQNDSTKIPSAQVQPSMSHSQELHVQTRNVTAAGLFM